MPALLLPRLSAVTVLAMALTCCLAGCGGYTNPVNPAPVVQGIVVTPIQPVGYSDQGAPMNQATFTASLKYTDGTSHPISSGVTWSYDAAPWVSLAKNTATCTEAAPQINPGVPSPSQITATASVDGVSYTASSALSCF